MMDALFCYHIVLMVMATVSFIFLWIGFATPGWLVVTFQEAQAHSEYTVSSLNRSLLYDIMCPQELKDCTSCWTGDSSKECVADMGFLQYSSHYNWIEVLTAGTEEWVAWLVIMIIANVIGSIGFILVLCIVCCLFTTSVYKIVAITGFFLWLIAGLLVWVPIGMAISMHMDIYDSVNDDQLFLGVNHDATLNFPYSILLVGIGGFLALVTALMLVWLTGVCDRHDDHADSYSGTDEMFSNPYKSQPVTAIVPREQRYYGPSPYYPQERPVYYSDQQPRVTHLNRNSGPEDVDDYPYYKGGVRENPWDPNPWYDNM